MSNMDANGHSHPVGIFDGDQRRIRRSLTPFLAISDMRSGWSHCQRRRTSTPPLPTPASRLQATKSLNF